MVTSAADGRIGIQMIHSRNGVKWITLGFNTQSRAVLQRKEGWAAKFAL